MEEDIELAIKVLIVGNGAVGKSSMIQRYCKGIFTHEYKKTIGVDFLEKKIQFDSRLCHHCHLLLECGASIYCWPPITAISHSRFPRGHVGTILVLR